MSPIQFLVKRVAVSTYTNIILAHDLMEYVDLVPENPFAKELKELVILEVAEAIVIPKSREYLIDLFNNQSWRGRQLVFIAKALKRKGLNPNPPYKWQSTHHCYVEGASDLTYYSHVAKRLSEKYGRAFTKPMLELDREPFKLLPWGIVDLHYPNGACGPPASSQNQKEQEFSKNATEPLTSQPTFPDIADATPISRIDLASYQGLLFKDLKPIMARVMPESTFVTYPYVLIVINTHGESVYAVTYEIMDLVNVSEFTDAFGADKDIASKSHMLCAFSQEGHINFGDAKPYQTKEAFLEKASDLAKNALGCL